MIPFVRRSDGIHLTLSTGERAMLGSLTEQLVRILGDGLEADPVVRRLFPDAYPDDAEASSEFRRFTFEDLHAQKTENARVVHDWLTGTSDGPFDAVAEQAWLRCLTDLRLTVAERLGIADAHDAEQHDARHDTRRTMRRRGRDDGGDTGLRDVYDWLGYVQEHLVMTLSAPSRNGREGRPA